MQVGEKYWVYTDSVYCEAKKPNSRPRVKGRVVWVHPKGKFATLELSGGLRECYWPEELTQGNKIKT